MTKLTDAQRLILSAAAERKDRAILPLLKSLRMNKGAAATVLKSLLKQGLVCEQATSQDDAVWREEKDGQRLTLVTTDSGLEAVGFDKKNVTAAPSRVPVVKPSRPTPKRKPAPKALAPKQRAGTKQAMLIELLSRKGGTTIPEIAKATGWQAHSVRGAISGALKKKLGLAVASEAVEGRGRVYRIAAGKAHGQSERAR